MSLCQCNMMSVQIWDEYVPIGDMCVPIFGTRVPICDEFKPFFDECVFIINNECAYM